MTQIRIDVVRGDGEVTRLKGVSGMAVCMGAPVTTPIERCDPPVISLRCNSEYELAWNLAALMAGVRHVSPHAFVMAQALAPLCDFDHPQIMHRLPPESGK